MQSSLKRSPSPSGQPGSSRSAAFRRAGRAGWRASPAALLALGIAMPARAAVTVIKSAVAGPITINPADEVDIVPGGSVSTLNGIAVTIFWTRRAAQRPAV